MGPTPGVFPCKELSKYVRWQCPILLGMFWPMFVVIAASLGLDKCAGVVWPPPTLLASGGYFGGKYGDMKMQG